MGSFKAITFLDVSMNKITVRGAVPPWSPPLAAAVCIALLLLSPRVCAHLPLSSSSLSTIIIIIITIIIIAIIIIVVAFFHVCV